MDEQSIFLAALEHENPEAQAQWLAKVCGADQALKARIEALLHTHREAGSFLERPAVDLEDTFVPDAAGLNLAAALNAGLSPAFTEYQAVIIGNAGHSVLTSLSETMDVPRVMLRDESRTIAEPIVRPKSAEMPKREPGSRYQLQGEIARGGMGAILKGRDTDLGRDLAIKVLLDQHKDRPEVVQRFVEEAQIGGQLQHPGIAPIYELGQFADRRPFFSMKLVKGETLAKLLAARVEPAADRGKLLGIFEQVCQTMAYAHSRGVIHRDLKPANIMVGAFGEVQVMDWGLAKVLPAGGIADEMTAHDRHKGQSIVQTLRNQAGSETPGTFASFGSQTQMGSVMGTPAYMPPEQALGEIDQMDERADVFGLGAILCEVLTGKPPYIGDDGARVFHLASRGNLTDCFARLDACAADAELIALTKHCLELEPHDRPRDAGVLAQRITGYLESVETKLRDTELERAAQTARAESETRRLEQQQRSARKLHKMLAGLAVVALIAGLACCVALVANMRANELAEVATQKGAAAQASAVDAERQRKAAVHAGLATAAALGEVKSQKAIVESSLAKAEQAEQTAIAEKNRADHEAEVAQQNLYFAQMHLALQAWREPRGLPYMKELLTNWQPKGESPDRRCWEWFYINSLPYQNLRTLMESESQGRHCTLAWHAASQRLATGTNDGLIRIWDIDREETILTLSGPGSAGGTWWEARWLGWSPDGGQLAAGFHDGTVHLWEPHTGRELNVIRGINSPVVALAYSSDESRLAIWGRDGSIKIWEINPGRWSAEVAHPPGVTSGAWSADEQILASGHYDGTVTTSGTQVGDKVVTLRGHVSQIHSLGWSPAGNRLASTSYDFTARIWDVAAEKMVVGPLRHSHEVTSVAWEPDGKRLATGSIDESVKVWDATTGREELTLRGHRASIASVAWGPDGRLASGGGDGSVRIWNSLENQESRVLPGHTVRATSVAWSPDGKHLASGGDDGKVRIWEPTTRQEVLAVTAHDAAQRSQQFGLIRKVVWSPNGTYLASAGLDGTAKVWEVATGREIFALPADRGAIWSVAWSSDGSRLAAGSEDGTIRVTAGFQHDPKVSRFHAHQGRVRNLAWSPAGDRLASVGWDGLVKIWDPNSGAELSRLPGHEFPWVLGVAWSPDGKRLASAGADGLVMAWDAQTGQKLSTMRGHKDFVDSVVWSPDGTRLASAGLDNSVRVWDPRTSEETFVLRGNFGMFHDVAWHPNGAQLAAASSDGQIWIWDATRGFERDTSPRALPYVDRQVASGTARGEDRRWFSESYIRAGKFSEALALVHNDPNSFRSLVGKLRSEDRKTFAQLWSDEARVASPAHNVELIEWAQIAEDLQKFTLAARFWERVLNGERAIGDASLTKLRCRAARAAVLAVAGQGENEPPLDDAAKAVLSGQALGWLKAELAQATDRAGKARIIAAAAPVPEVLDHLADGAGNDAQFQADLARIFSERGDITRASTARAKACALLEQQLAQEPENSALAAELADVMLIDATRWTVLQPTELTSEKGAALTLQGDGSILVSGTNTDFDVYKISLVIDLDRIQAVRLEALPDMSLPSRGPGRHPSGNFNLRAFRIYQSPGESESGLSPVPVSRAWASFEYQAADAGIAGAIDEKLNKFWHVWGRTGEAHQAVFLLRDSVAGKGGTFVIELRHHHNLGRFRLSASTDPAVLGLERRLFVIRKLTEPWVKLASAYHILGDQSALDNLLNRQPAAIAGIGDLYTAEKNWEQAIAEYSKWINAQTTDISLLSKRAAAYIATQNWESARSDWRRVVALQPSLMRSAFDEFQKASRWNEAAEFGQQLVQQQPEEAEVWLHVAPVLVLVNDQQAYSDHCGRMVGQFADSTELVATERFVKACLLRPNTIDLAKLPVHVFSKVLDDRTAPDWFLSWGWTTRALWAYRGGDAELAIEFATKSEANQLNALTHAENLAVLALAHHQLQHVAEARRALDEAAQLLPRLQADEALKGQHDLLIAQILYREAEALISGRKQP